LACESQKRFPEALPTGLEGPDLASLVAALVELPDAVRAQCLDALAAVLRSLPLLERASLAAKLLEPGTGELIEQTAREGRKGATGGKTDPEDTLVA
jgi:hypothetical protein